MKFALHLRSVYPITTAFYRLKCHPPFGAVLSFCSKTTLRLHPIRNSKLQRSPRSNPTVNFFCAKILLCLPATVILFLIAGLLYLLRLVRVCHWELIASRLETGILIPSVYSAQERARSTPCEGLHFQAQGASPNRSWSLRKATKSLPNEHDHTR